MNPVTIIRSYLEIMLSDLEGGLSSDQIEFVKTAHSATVTLNRIIDDVVDLAALELGAAELQMVTVGVDEVVEEVGGSHAPSVEAGGIEFSVSIASNLPRVRADADRLKNAIGEILSNAVQSTPRRGRIGITAERRGTDVVIGVTDSGRGIAEDQLDAVFEPFVRVPRKEGEPRRGAGLGLAIARRQIEAMGGRVTVSSQVGSGTIFEIVLPASKVDE
jgi:two-component system sensor histidine kinase BaeS